MTTDRRDELGHRDLPELLGLPSALALQHLGIWSTFYIGWETTQSHGWLQLTIAAVTSVVTLIGVGIAYSAGMRGKAAAKDGKRSSWLSRRWDDLVSGAIAVMLAWLLGAMLYMVVWEIAYELYPATFVVVTALMVTLGVRMAAGARSSPRARRQCRFAVGGLTAIWIAVGLYLFAAIGAMDAAMADGEPASLAGSLLDVPEVVAGALDLLFEHPISLPLAALAVALVAWRLGAPTARKPVEPAAG